MNWYLIGIPAAVLVAGVGIRVYVGRKSGNLLSESSRRNLTGFVILASVLVGLAALAVALNPATADTLVVSMVRSLPSLLLSGIIVILAILLGRIAAGLTARALRSWSSVVAQRVARFVKAAIIAVGSIIALDQLGVSTELIVIMIAAVVGAFALAGALAFGLGSVPLARQVAAGRHVSERFHVGQHVRNGKFAGTIVELGLSSARVANDNGGYVEVPNTVFLEESIEVAGPTPD